MLIINQNIFLHLLHLKNYNSNSTLKLIQHLILLNKTIHSQIIEFQSIKVRHFTVLLNLLTVFRLLISIENNLIVTKIT